MPDQDHYAVLAQAKAVISEHKLDPIENRKPLRNALGISEPTQFRAEKKHGMPVPYQKGGHPAADSLDYMLRYFSKGEVTATMVRVVEVATG